MSSISLRGFRNGDEPAIAKLFNSVYCAYEGFVLRTADYWRWCCLERPDVEKDGILLAFDDGEFCGYIVAGFTGNIWEFCVTNDNREVAVALLNSAIEYLEKKGASSIKINVPKGTGITSILQEIGFDELPAARMFVTTLNPSTLIQYLASPLHQVLREKLNDDFCFRLSEVPCYNVIEFSVKVHEKSVEVTEGIVGKSPVIVELKFMDFLLILFKGSSATRLFLLGKMKVRPMWKILDVLQFLSTVRLKSSWFFPLADVI
jgi:hypothetical protein